MTFIIKLPLPSRKLSPNARLHWAAKSKITKQHRVFSMLCFRMQTGLETFKIKSYRLLFYWPDKRRRDRDNASSCCKAYLDGIADATGQNDADWGFNGVVFMEPDKHNPRLEIEIETE